MYEDITFWGTELGNLFFLFHWNIRFGTPFLILYGLFSGIFLGGWIMALAEMADIFPIFARRIRFQRGLSFTILCIAAGKTVGALIYYITDGCHNFQLIFNISAKKAAIDYSLLRSQ